MKTLNQNWITEGIIDFEYKKYVLLAYLQGIKKAFDMGKLYPFMSDLIVHYNKLLQLRQSKEVLAEDAPKEIESIDIENLSISYRQILKDSDLMQEIFAVVNYALPKMKQSLEDGKDLYETVERKMQLEQVGLLPLYRQEGYLLLKVNKLSDLMVFRYSLSKIKSSQESYLGINTNYLKRERVSLVNTIQNIKLDLIKQYKDLPNPATYVLLSDLQLPLKHTLLPIAQRMLLRNLAA